MRFDDDGYLWFCRRRKQIIVRDGSNISPQEVEGALLEHPAVREAAVVGVHDLVHGENVRAYVTLEAGAAAPRHSGLVAFARERIGYKAPEQIVFLTALPLTPVGKIDRTQLERQAEEELGAVPT
jgi:long-chain acyl-CoA synthetase